mgnify:CR=1 FL=1
MNQFADRQSVEGAATAGSLTVRDVRMAGQQGPVDIVVRDGIITRVCASAPGSGPEAGVTIDGRGFWAIGGLVDAHAHLDKTLVGLPYHPNPGGRSVQDLADAERELRPTLPNSVRQRVELLLTRLVTLGTSHIRSHVDVDTTAGLSNLVEVLAARRAFAGLIDVQIVAFPQSGLLRRAGTVGLMEEAMRSGADLVGGLDPAGVDQDPAAHLDAVFGLAEKVGRGIDIHLHDAGELGAWEIDQIVARTLAHGMQGLVTISHAAALGEVSRDRQDQLLARLAEHGVSIATVAPGRGVMLPVSRMVAAGVVVATGNDGIRDMWNPYATGDMLLRAQMLAWRCGFRTDEDIELALDIATGGGARALGVRNYGVVAGCRGDFVLAQGQTIGDVVVTHDPRRWVIKGGVVVGGPNGAPPTVPAGS